MFSFDDLCLVMLAGMVHENVSYTRIVRVAGYNNNAQQTGDSRNTYCMLYHML